MSNQQHIRVVQEDDRLTLVCDDFELFDWMEDVFTEQHNIELVHLRTLSETNQYKLIFPKSVSIEFVTEIIDGLDSAEVERIYLLNNTNGSN